jgi:hypothetical protein
MQRKGVPPVLAKLSGDSVPFARHRYASRSDREQLATPDRNPNHHAQNESKAAIPRKSFFTGASLCMIPLWQQPRASPDANASGLALIFHGR